VVFHSSGFSKVLTLTLNKVNPKVILLLCG
jgi:hypothetical protein